MKRAWVIVAIVVACLLLVGLFVGFWMSSTGKTIYDPVPEYGQSAYFNCKWAGDVDNNSVINSLDADYVRMYVLGYPLPPLVESYIWRGDVNYGGTITTLDRIILVRNYSLNISLPTCPCRNTDATEYYADGFNVHTNGSLHNLISTSADGDTCNGDVLLERSCRFGGSVEPFDCRTLGSQWGCRNGACVLAY